MTREQRDALYKVLRVALVHAKVLELVNTTRLSFDAIGRRVGCSGSAVRDIVDRASKTQ